jgi:hypothetical protein
VASKGGENLPGNETKRAFTVLKSSEELQASVIDQSFIQLVPILPSNSEENLSGDFGLERMQSIAMRQPVEQVYTSNIGSSSGDNVDHATDNNNMFVWVDVNDTYEDTGLA